MKAQIVSDKVICELTHWKPNAGLTKLVETWIARMLRGVAAFVILSTILSIFTPSGLAAQETTGTLGGRVIGPGGAPIPDVAVTVTSPALQGARGTVTASDGRFLMLFLPVGEYQVKFIHVSFQEHTIKCISVLLGRRTTLGNVKLEERVYTMPLVQVTASQPLLDPRSTSFGANLRLGDYIYLPVERDYRAFASLLPHANASSRGDGINFAGSTGLENRTFIDGMDVTEPNRGLPSISLPYNFVKELEIRTGGYEAENRSALGGVINVLTKSGSNTRNAEVFGFFLNNRLAGERRMSAFEARKGDFARYDVGFGVGGPIRKNRLWYYLAYSPAIEQEDVEVPGTGFHQDKTITHSFAGKFILRGSPNHTFVLTALGDPTERHGVGATYVNIPIQPVTFITADSYLENITSGSMGLLLEGRHFLGENIFITTSISRVQYRETNLPATEKGRKDLLFIDSETGTWSGGTPAQIENASRVVIAGLTSTWLHGAHEFKGGFEFKDSQWRFDMLTRSITRYSDAYYVLFNMYARGRVGVQVPSVFLQDSWLLTDRLRLNGGLRWDGQFVISTEGKVAQSIVDQWQPRVGFIYRPGNAVATKISGSFGRFYQELATYPMFFYYSPGNQFGWITYDHDPRYNPAGGDTTGIPGTIQKQIDDMEGQYFDEITLGYERQVGHSTVLCLRGIYRTLRQGIEDGTNPLTGEIQLNNPGRGALKNYPRVKRNYSAIEFSCRRNTGERLTVLASYVLSRTYGNYPGLFNSDFNGPYPNGNTSFDVLEALANGEGLLPNDIPHVLKLAGCYQVNSAVTVGTVLHWQSGTPLNEFGGSRTGPPIYNFLRKRGTAGRTPAIWDLSLRLTFTPRIGASGSWEPKITVDFLHVGSQRKPIEYDQIHYFNVDEAGNQINPNPNYGKAIRYQPPMAIRLGAEVRF